MLKYTSSSREIRTELEALAYWISSLAWTRENYFKEDREEWILKYDRNIKFCFDMLDKLEVPYWVQNSTVSYAEDWRLRGMTDFENWLADNKNIFLGHRAKLPA